jgi:hypothetical protein
MLRKLKFQENLTKMTGTLDEDRYTFMITSGSVLLRMRNVFKTKLSRKSKHSLYSYMLCFVLCFVVLCCVLCFVV